MEILKIVLMKYFQLTLLSLRNLWTNIVWGEPLNIHILQRKYKKEFYKHHPTVQLRTVRSVHQRQNALSAILAGLSQLHLTALIVQKDVILKIVLFALMFTDLNLVNYVVQAFALILIQTHVSQLQSKDVPCVSKQWVEMEKI